MVLKRWIAHKWMLALHGAFFLFVLVMAPLSFYGNFGWIRSMLAAILIPYYIIYAFFNLGYLLFLWIAPRRMIPLFWLSGLTFLAANLLMPDMDGPESRFAFFQQVVISGPDSTLMRISNLCWAIHLLIGFIQLIQWCIDLIRISKNAKPTHLTA